MENKKKDLSQWYLDIIYKAQLADQSPTRGCIAIRPYGYALWEKIKKVLDDRIKKTGHENVALPLLIPYSFIKKESGHIEGFSPELALVTHAGGKELKEPLVVRPTSETMVYYMFSRWIKSWRDLPLKINQWANVVRWEMRTRPFLRTTEFFWQEGHTAHQTYDEAYHHARMMIEEYRLFVENYLAIPVICGKKSESEKFPGATITFTIEAIMPDGKALQLGTSHILSQDFARAFDVSYQDRQGVLQYPYFTSWGMTTRLIGAVVMVHGDDKGLILPPKIAPKPIVIVPIFRKKNEGEINTFCAIISEKLSAYSVVIDHNQETKTPGAKFYHWEVRGVPLRIEIGMRDIKQNGVTLVNRLSGEKQFVLTKDLCKSVDHMLEDIQTSLFVRAKNNTVWAQGKKLSSFGADLMQNNGLYAVSWCEKKQCESELKAYKATIRCIVDSNSMQHETCFACTDASKVNVIIAKAY